MTSAFPRQRVWRAMVLTCAADVLVVGACAAPASVRPMPDGVATLRTLAPVEFEVAPMTFDVAPVKFEVEQVKFEVEQVKFEVDWLFRQGEARCRVMCITKVTLTN